MFQSCGGSIKLLHLKLKIPIASVIVTYWLKPTHTTQAIWELRTEIHDSFPKKAQRTFT